MRTTVEFIGGFLGAGKTNFLNSYVKTTYIEDEVIILIQCEFGKTKISDDIRIMKGIVIKEVKGGQNPTPDFLRRIINFYGPNRIIIECNGVISPNKLKELFMDNEFLKKNTKIGAFFTLINGALFSNMIRNLAPIMLPQICIANMIIINEWDKVIKNEKDKMVNIIGENNPMAYIFKLNGDKSFESFLKKSFLIDKGLLRRFIFILRGDR